MTREFQISAAQENMQAQAEQIARLMDIAGRASRKEDRALAEDRLHVIEQVLWRNHARLVRLKAEMAAIAS